MADHKITDFVDAQAIAKLQELNDKMMQCKDTYVTVADELLKGISIKINGIQDLDRLISMREQAARSAAEATNNLNKVSEEQNRILARTTAVSAEALQQQAKLNNEVRQSAVDHSRIKKVLEEVNGTYENRVRRLVQVEREMKNNAEQMKSLAKAYKDGSVSEQQYENAMVRLTASQRDLAAQKNNLTSLLKNEEKEMNSVQGSYNHLSQELEILKKAYKDLTDEEKSSAFGKEMLDSINALDTELKHQAEAMGEHQRNVGDYAIAVRDGSVAMNELNEVLAINAGTIAGCIEQNRELEKAKLNLNTADADYEQTLARINAKIEENKQRILDVDGILAKEATTVAEAEQQNKQLAEALKHIDFTSEGAQARVVQLNAKIEANKKVIEQTTPALKKQAEQTEALTKANEGLAGQLLTTMGLNSKFGSSLTGLAASAANGGNALAGLGTKLKAFGTSLMTLLSNPTVLAFLGVGGAVMGFKAWYDYNAGCAEAMKLTKQFTGLAGQDLEYLRSDIQALADTHGKEFKDVLNATDKVASQLGISYQEALGAIKDGFVAGADAQDNFLSNVEKFTPALRDAGLNARELVAVLQQTRSGLFNEDGLKAIQVASDRLKRMPKNAADALSALGLSTKQIQKDLESGTKSMMDVVKEVSGKLKEFPQNSEAYGDAIYNVFGRKAAAGGAQLIEVLADLETDLDKLIEQEGNMGRLTKQNQEAMERLGRAMCDAFKLGATSFEEIELQAKNYIVNGIAKMLEGLAELRREFKRLYNSSLMFRGAVNGIGAAFANMWTLVKTFIKLVADGFQSLGGVIQAALELNPKKIVDNWSKTLRIIGQDMKGMVDRLVANTKAAFNNSFNNELIPEEEKRGGSFHYNQNNNSPRNGKAVDVGGGRGKGGSGKASHANTKAAQNAAREQLKIQQDLEEATLRAMDEGHEKELEKIRVAYAKKINAITGNSAKEKQLRKALTEEMAREIAKCEEEYQAKKAKTDIANRLAAAAKDSKEARDLKIKQLEQQRDDEIEEAKKTGADVEAIREKYDKEIAETRASYANASVKEIQETYATEAALAENVINARLAQRQRQYAADLEAAKGDAEKREEITRKYEEDVAKITERYAKQQAADSIAMYEQILKTEDLTDEEREKMSLELAKAKMALEKAVADETLAQSQRVVDAEVRNLEKRKEGVGKWLDVASRSLNAINDLTQAVFSAKIQRIEEEEEAVKNESDSEVAKITELVEKKVITEEEGEARKRAAEARTAKKTEELERKKQQMQHRQAVWDKANSLAQAGIATALAIVQALPNIPLAAIAGAMGALQIATILATPIPKYAKGTDYHRGGLAIVGDGGKPEIVEADGKVYITPSTPTLVDMPVGAAVYPDAREIAMTEALTPLQGGSEQPKVIVNNDYGTLDRNTREIADLLRRQIKQQRKIAYDAQFEQYRISRGI